MKLTFFYILIALFSQYKAFGQLKSQSDLSMAIRKADSIEISRIQSKLFTELNLSKINCFDKVSRKDFLKQFYRSLALKLDSIKFFSAFSTLFEHHLYAKPNRLHDLRKLYNGNRVNENRVKNYFIPPGKWPVVHINRFQTPQLDSLKIKYYSLKVPLVFTYYQLSDEYFNYHGNHLFTEGIYSHLYFSAISVNNDGFPGPLFMSMDMCDYEEKKSFLLDHLFRKFESIDEAKKMFVFLLLKSEFEPGPFPNALGVLDSSIPIEILESKSDLLRWRFYSERFKAVVVGTVKGTKVKGRICTDKHVGFNSSWKVFRY